MVLLAPSSFALCVSSFALNILPTRFEKRLKTLTLNNASFTQFSGFSVFIKGHWNTADFVTNYLPFGLFPILYLGAKYWTRVPVVPLSEMDFYTGLAEIEADTYEEPPPKNRVEAIWQWLVSNRVEAFLYASAQLLNRCEW
jgi:amino acid permease